MTAQNNLEENKRIVRAFIETAFNQHQTDRVADHLTADMKWHGGTLGTVEGRDNLVGLVGAIVSALPDLQNVEQDERIDRERLLALSPRFTAEAAQLMPESGWQPLMSFRTGYPTVNPSPSPRRGAEAVLLQ
jgi:hypothetical protein